MWLREFARMDSNHEARGCCPGTAFIPRWGPGSSRKPCTGLGVCLPRLCTFGGFNSTCYLTGLEAGNPIPVSLGENPGVDRTGSREPLTPGTSSF